MAGLEEEDDGAAAGPLNNAHVCREVDVPPSSGPMVALFTAEPTRQAS